MDYLLDTNAISDLVSEHPRITARLASLPGGDRVFTCAIVHGEVLFGLGRLPVGKRRTTLEQKTAGVMAGLPSEAIPAAAAEAYARVKLTRQRSGLALDENDCWIAATALALGATIVSRDSDLLRIDGLAVEDWSV